MNLQRAKYKDIERIPHLTIPKNFKDTFFGSSPAPFIGRYGYPKVNIGLLSPQVSGDTSNYDSPKLWSQKSFPIQNIASLRYGLVNSRTTAEIKATSNPYLHIIQEVGMASKPVELEVHLTRIPTLLFTPEKEIIPFGPQGEIKKARITSNSNIDSRVEKIVCDTDLKAAPAIMSLYQKGFEENFLTKLISVGNLGLKNNRKLVPTRWSITAVDDTLGKKLIQEVKDLQLGEYQLYFGGGWGNYYLLLFFPEVWSYELFETYISYKVNPWNKEGNFYSTDYENYNGRKTYAQECAGGYYAARLPILEKMKELKRQHSCLALRFITPEYNVPLGVWVCREAARKSLAEKPLTFASQELMVKYAQELLQRKFNFELHLLLTESKLLKKKKEQKRINQFYN